MSESDFEIENGVLKKYVGKGGVVSIPKGVTEIGKQAFNYCGSLKSVSIPEGVEKIGYGTFEGCGSLESVSIPESVKEISFAAFKDTPLLERVILSGSALPRGLAVGPDTALVSSALTVSDSDGETIPKASIAAGRILHALEHPGCDPDDATRRYVRSQLMRVCASLRFNPAALRWIVDNDLATKAGAAKAAVECTERGLVEAAAIFLGADKSGKKATGLKL